MAISLPERLCTPRLVLREPREADAVHIFDAYTQDPEVARYMVWRPHQVVGETADFISYCMQGWASGRSRPYVLARSENDGIAIGMLDARIFSNTIDIGYVLQRSCWGNGLMSEAVDAFSNAALAYPECFRVQATCDTENHASARTLQKCGFAMEGRLERHIVLPNLGREPRASLMYARCR
ncbi:GNAT family N-acetyltransferase [Massilia sp. TWR1-2-2]|uniref:GNAT family N-acetyltransferase n=1 Tax=Massilia sp. TWR1-2-2 TaxID=2804584 RepID=UPI003CE6FAC3